MWSYNYTSELYHYGVKGMKWGVRRYQNKDGSLTAKGKNHKKTDVNSSAKDPKAFVANRGNQKAGSLSSDEAALLVQASVFVAIIGASIASQGIKMGVEKKQFRKELDELNKNKEIKSLKTAPRLAKKMTASESMKVVNPDFPNGGTTLNCTFCTTAMAMREKGYAVKASKTDHCWYTNDLFKTTFNAKLEKVPKRKTGDDIMNSLASAGDGAYGNLSINWKMGGGHSIFWKNEGGKTRIYDGQSGEEYTASPYQTKSLFNSINTKYTTYCRLDNCEPTEHALAILESSKQ